MNESNYWQRNIGGAGLNRRAFLRSAALTGVGTAAFLAGCGGGDSGGSGAGDGAPGGGTGAVTTGVFAVPEAKRGGKLTIAGRDPTLGWDPHASISYLVGNVTDQMHLKLIRHDYRKNWKSGNDEAIIGELAEKWESPDPLTYNFTIRKGLNWPDQEPMNGRPVKAQDVKYAFDHGKLPSSLVQEYVWNNIKSATVIDDYTVQMKANYPHWRWLMDLDSYSTMIMPEGVYEWAGSSGMKDPAKARGGGPYIPTDYKPNSLIVYKPNEAYRKVFGTPYIDQFDYALIEPGPPQQQAFIAKTLDFYSPPSGQLEETIKARPDAKTKLNEYAPTNTNALFMKTTEKPWDDVRARRALSMAVDREGWGKTLIYEFKWESGPITWGYPDWKLAHDKMPAEVQKWLKYDPAEAAKLTQAAGISAAAEYVMHMFPYSSAYTPESQFLIDSLQKVGITSKLKVYEYNNWLQTAYIGQYSGLLYGPDNLDRITQQLADRLLANSSRNHSHVQDAQTQKLLNDFALAKSPAEAKSVANAIQTRSVDQAYAVYRPQPVSPLMWNPAVQNYDGQNALAYQTQYRTAFMWLA